MKPLIDFHTHHLHDGNVNIYIVDLSNIILPKKPHYFCLGIHPWYIERDSWELFERLLKENYQKENFFALGELGLDKSGEIDLDLQKKIFVKQLKLAKELGINRIVLHNVKTYSETLEILIIENYQGTVILHDYRKIAQVFKQFNSHFKSYVSLKEQSIQSLETEHIPLDRVLVETDDDSFPIARCYQELSKKYQVSQNQILERLHQNLADLLA